MLKFGKHEAVELRSRPVCRCGIGVSVGDHWRVIQASVRSVQIGRMTAARQALVCSDATTADPRHTSPLHRLLQRRALLNKRSLSQPALVDLQVLTGGDPRQRRQDPLERISENLRGPEPLKWQPSPEDLIRRFHEAVLELALNRSSGAVARLTESD
jgi:hypothetical protein